MRSEEDQLLTSTTGDTTTVRVLLYSPFRRDWLAHDTQRQSGYTTDALNEPGYTGTVRTVLYYVLYIYPGTIQRNFKIHSVHVKRNVIMTSYDFSEFLKKKRE